MLLPSGQCWLGWQLLCLCVPVVPSQREQRSCPVCDGSAQMFVVWLWRCKASWMEGCLTLIPSAILFTLSKPDGQTQTEKRLEWCRLKQLLRKVELTDLEQEVHPLQGFCDDAVCVSGPFQILVNGGPRRVLQQPFCWKRWWGHFSRTVTSPILAGFSSRWFGPSKPAGTCCLYGRLLWWG